MKYLRKPSSTLLIALGLSAICAMPSFAQSERTPHQRQPPKNINALRLDVKSQNRNIQRGVDRPKHVVLAKGKPIPKGYTRRLTYGEYRYLPRYQGYEWHITGRDLVLVAVATGIAYAILDNVLN